MRKAQETYLGDGLYVSYDPSARIFILRAPREGGDHWVGLELEVLENFLLYIRGITGKSHDDHDIH